MGHTGTKNGTDWDRFDPVLTRKWDRTWGDAIKHVLTTNHCFLALGAIYLRHPRAANPWFASLIQLRRPSAPAGANDTNEYDHTQKNNHLNDGAGRHAHMREEQEVGICLETPGRHTLCGMGDIVVVGVVWGGGRKTRKRILSHI